MSTLTRKTSVILCMIMMLLMSGVLAVHAAERTTITIAFWGGNEDIDINQAIKEAFEAENPDIEVELLLIADGYGDKIDVMIASGTAPDVIMQAEGFSGYAVSGAIVPLDRFIESDPDFDMDDYYPLVVDAYRYDGSLYVLPSRWSPLIMYYNPYLFDQAGVAHPDTDWNWDAFASAARRLTRGEGGSKIWGIGSIGDWWPWWMTPIYQNGGQVLNADRTETLMHQSEAIEALEWYQSLLHEQRVNPVGGDWDAYPGMGPDQLFESGITAMNQTGFWAVYWLRYHGTEFDVTFLPQQKQRATTLFSNGWAISSQSKSMDSAWRVVKFWTDEFAQREIAYTGKDVPVRRSVAGSPAFLDPDQRPNHAQLILESAAHIVAPPVTPHWDQMIGLMGSEIVRMINNEISPTEAVNNFKGAVDLLLQLD